MINQTKEDYLRAIYHFVEDQKGKNQGVSSVDLSSYLNISKSSVSEMLRKLVKEDLIQPISYGKIILTKKGLTLSKDVTRRHRIIESFLSNILKIKKQAIHEEAHKLEHAFSEESITSLSKLIKSKHCPHGKKIPVGE